jgi:hypothetical protein
VFAVYRYVDPDLGQAAAFARGVGAPTPMPGPASPPAIATFAGSGFTVSVTTSDGARRADPRFSITENGAAGTARGSAGDAELVSAAAGYAAARHLDTAAAAAVIERSEGDVHVLYPRSLRSEAATLPVYDSSGRPDGIRLRVIGAAILGAEGPAAAPQPSGSYRSRTTEEAVRVLERQAPAAAYASVKVVYLPVPAPGGGFYEPVYLFSAAPGGGAGAGAVLAVPALDASVLQGG